MATEEKKFNVDFDEADRKKLKQVKAGYSIAQFGGGIEKAYYSSFASYFYTNVYMMSTVFSGILTLISSIVGWVGAPLFGAILDKIKFKNGKYWPWLIIGPIIYNLAWILIYALPALGVSGEGTGIIALILACIAQVGAPLMTIPMNASMPLLSNDPSDRQFFAKAQKLGRDGAKTIFGYIFPAAIAALTLSSGESTAYALCVLFGRSSAYHLIHILCFCFERLICRKKSGRVSIIQAEEIYSSRGYAQNCVYKQTAAFDVPFHGASQNILFHIHYMRYIYV